MSAVIRMRSDVSEMTMRQRSGNEEGSLSDLSLKNSAPMCALPNLLPVPRSAPQQYGTETIA